MTDFWLFNTLVILLWLKPEKRTAEHQAEKLVIAIQMAFQGLQIDPCRAEFFHVIGECNLKMNRLPQALTVFCGG